MNKEIKIEAAEGIIVTISVHHLDAGLPAAGGATLDATPLAADVGPAISKDRIGLAAKLAGIGSAVIAILRLFMN